MSRDQPPPPDGGDGGNGGNGSRRPVAVPVGIPAALRDTSVLVPASLLPPPGTLSERRHPSGRARAAAGPRYTPAELAHLLGLHPPTPEQAAVISAPVGPLLVVAGAGSGKTETMAARVVWLVANGYVRPDQVLGLTFTRKAAGELARRVRIRLAQLVRRVGRDELILGEPVVATYHSYAARIATEQGLRAGYEPTARLLTEAACWQLADAIVRNYDGDMSAVDSAPSTVVDSVLRLASELAEHLVEPDELATWTGRFHADVSARQGRTYKAVAELLGRQRARLALLPMVREYAARKRVLEAIDYGDQLTRAARVAAGHPQVGAAERERYRVVLLDEYQDTSHAQVTLLRALYGGGHPVTAVGDPCQSIYGWRGASAGALDRFPQQFPHRSGTPATTLSLSTSWRNRPEILVVANTLSAPLREAGHRVPVLRSPARTGTPVDAATVRCALLETFLDEADWIADRLLAVWRRADGARAPSGVAGEAAAGGTAARGAVAGEPVTSGAAAGEAVAGEPAAGEAAADGARAPSGAAGATAASGPERRTGGDAAVTVRPTAAVLVRGRAQIPVIEAALRRRGLPVEIVGLGGLLDTPEVRDVVSTLRVLADPTAGAALLRLLTGPRWRIGPRDLVALYRRARDMAPPRQRGPGAPAQPNRLDEATLIEALDDLGDPGIYSPAGYHRFSILSAEFGGLRRRLDQPLPDLLTDIERTIGLDVEVAVAPGDAGLARAHLDALGEVAARFAAEADGATLTSFLAYLEAAESEERGLSPGEVTVAEGAVQILTAHAAKGLEWDVVAVPGLSDRVFPAAPRGTDHWLRGLGVLPFPLRGDRDGLPPLELSGAADQKEIAARVDDFTEGWREHREREERRLAYVAVTRPRRLLLCSGYWWGEGVRRPRGPSAFLDEVRHACDVAHAGVVDEWAPAPAPDQENPVTARATPASWPADPLGARRQALTDAATSVRAAMFTSGSHDEPSDEPVPVAVVPQPDTVVPHATVVPQPDTVVPQPAAVGDGTGTLVDPPVGEEIDRWTGEVDLLLAERTRLATDPGAPVQVVLPGELTVSQLVQLRRDPDALARRLRRPVPVRPDPYARRGTTFHQWLEQRFGTERLLDLDELPGAADATLATDDALAELQRTFLASGWADRVPVATEVPFSTVVAGMLLRGRMDAVFADGRDGFDVIDWKTGRQPAGADATAAAVQLSAYRLAWAQLAGVPVDRVRAAFHYVRTGTTVRPVDLLDAAGLAALLAGLPVAPAEPGPAADHRP